MRYTGKVKWFNESKGYGFIQREEGPDLFVHYTNIVGKGFRTLKENDEVEFYRHGTPGSAHIYDAAIAIGFRALKEICGSTWKPLRDPVFPRSTEGSASLSARLRSACSIRCRGVRHRVRSVVA